jgi:cytochrome o ubiquinol oxidase subunit 2
MHFDAHAVPAEQFAAWIETTRATGPTLDAASYAALARQSKDVSPFTYRAAAPELFQQIATQLLPPAPGPQTGRPNPNVSPRTE